MKLNCLIATLAIALFATVPTHAAFEDVFYSARSAAMGGAMTAVSDDSVSLFYNPAGLGQIRNPQVEANFLNAKSSPSGPAAQQVTDGTAIIPAGNLNGTFGIAGLYNQNGSLDETGREVKLGYGSRGLLDTGSGALDFGGALNYLDSGVQGTPAAAHADIDMGTLYRFGDRYSFGASILNLGEPHFHGINGLVDQAPTTFRAGFAESLSGYTVALDAVHSNAAGPIPSLTYAALGMERWIPTAQYGSVAARAGLDLGNQNKSLSLGAGWRIMGAEVDYAVIVPLSGPTAFTNAISMSFRFGVSDPQAEFERILREEIDYRKKLTQALEAGEVHQWQLTQELTSLQSQLDALKNELADKNLSAQQAEAKLEELKGKYHDALGKFEKIKNDRARAAKTTDQDRFQQDWAAYQKLKMNGAPDSLLISDVKEILRAYKAKNVDLAPANRELLRLLGQ